MHWCRSNHWDCILPIENVRWILNCWHNHFVYFHLKNWHNPCVTFCIKHWFLSKFFICLFSNQRNELRSILRNIAAVIKNEFARHEFFCFLFSFISERFPLNCWISFWNTNVSALDKFTEKQSLNCIPTNSRSNYCFKSLIYFKRSLYAKA